MLFEDVVEEGGHGDEDGGGGDPEGGGLADGGVLGLDLVGLHIENVVLLEIIVGRCQDIGIVEVDGVDLLVALGIFTDELHALTDTIDGEVTCLGQGLEDVDLLTGYLIATRTVYFTEDRDGVAGHADGDHGVLCGIEIGFDFIVDEFLTLALGEATNLDITNDGEIDTALVINQIGLEGTA